MPSHRHEAGLSPERPSGGGVTRVSVAVTPGLGPWSGGHLLGTVADRRLDQSPRLGPWCPLAHGRSPRSGDPSDIVSQTRTGSLRPVPPFKPSRPRNNETRGHGSCNAEGDPAARTSTPGPRSRGSGRKWARSRRRPRQHGVQAAYAYLHAAHTPGNRQMDGPRLAGSMGARPTNCARLATV